MQLNSAKFSLQDRNRRRHNLLRPQRPNRLDGKEKLCWFSFRVEWRVFGAGVEGVDVVAEGGVGGEGPFFVEVFLGPEGGVAEGVVWVVLECDCCSRAPLCMFLSHSLF